MHENASVLLPGEQDENILAYLCRQQKDKVLVILNFSTRSLSFDIDHPAAAGCYYDLFEKKW